MTEYTPERGSRKPSQTTQQQSYITRRRGQAPGESGGMNRQDVYADRSTHEREFHQGSPESARSTRPHTSGNISGRAFPSSAQQDRSYGHVRSSRSSRASVHMSTPDERLSDHRRYVAEEQRRAHQAQAARGTGRASASRASATKKRSVSRAASSQLSSGSMSRRQFTGIAGALAAGVSVLTAGGILFSRRAVAFEINGAQAKAANHSSIKAIVDKGLIKPKYGNLIDVAGDLLEPGKGERYTVSVNGVDLGEDIDSYRLKSGDKLVFTDGVDKMEEHQSQKTPIPFKWVHAKGSGAVGFIEKWGKEGYSEVLVGKISGKTVKKDQAEAAEDRVIRYINIQPKNGEKICAITFDDGPSEFTLKIFDILSKYNVKATFFDIGSNAKHYPDIIKKMIDAGHEVGSHTVNHYNLQKLKPEDVKSEVANGVKLVQAAGSTSRLFRAPYGSFGDREWTIVQDEITALLGWNNDSLDWNKSTSPEQLIKNSTTNKHPGAIILCHAGGGNRDKTVACLPSILESWINEGYKFVTISELLASDERVPEAVAKGQVKRPDGGGEPQSAEVVRESGAAPDAQKTMGDAPGAAAPSSSSSKSKASNKSSSSSKKSSKTTNSKTASSKTANSKAKSSKKKS